MLVEISVNANNSKFTWVELDGYFEMSELAGFGVSLTLANGVEGVEIIGTPTVGQIFTAFTPHQVILGSMRCTAVNGVEFTFVVDFLSEFL